MRQSGRTGRLTGVFGTAFLGHLLERARQGVPRAHVSMLASGEIMVAIWSHGFAEQLAARPREMIAHGPPEVYEYTIERDADGQPVRSATGEPMIRFGPADHTDSEEWPRLGFRWIPLNAIPWLAGIPPLF